MNKNDYSNYFFNKLFLGKINLKPIHSEFTLGIISLRLQEAFGSELRLDQMVKILVILFGCIIFWYMLWYDCLTFVVLRD
jgi:tellurite resistance protein TehA-like permease